MHHATCSRTLRPPRLAPQARTPILRATQTPCSSPQAPCLSLTMPTPHLCLLLVCMPPKQWPLTRKPSSRQQEPELQTQSTVSLAHTPAHTSFQRLYCASAKIGAPLFQETGYEAIGLLGFMNPGPASLLISVSLPLLRPGGFEDVCS